MDILNLLGKMEFQSFNTEIEYQGHKLVVEGNYTPTLPADWENPKEPAEVEIEKILLGDIDVTEMFNGLYEVHTKFHRVIHKRAASDVIVDLIYKKLEL
jgi:hypothetical protein